MNDLIELIDQSRTCENIGGECACLFVHKTRMREYEGTHDGDGREVDEKVCDGNFFNINQQSHVWKKKYKVYIPWENVV